MSALLVGLWAGTMLVVLLGLSPRGEQRGFVHAAWVERRSSRELAAWQVYLAAVGGALGWSKLREKLALRLERAGFPGALSVDETAGLAMVVTLVVGLWVFSNTSDLAGRSWWPGLFLGAGAGLGVLVLWIDDQTLRRRADLDRALPYALDLVVLCLGSGNTLAGALEELQGRLPQGPLADALAECRRRVLLGEGWPEAFFRVGQESGSVLFAQLSAQILAARSSGAPLVENLSALSRTLRERRYRRAERLASEAPVKAMAPLLFIFVACVATVFGPILVRLMRGEVLA